MIMNFMAFWVFWISFLNRLAIKKKPIKITESF